MEKITAGNILHRNEAHGIMWSRRKSFGSNPSLRIILTLQYLGKFLMNVVQQIKMNQLQITQILPVGPSLSRESLILRMGSQCGFFEHNNEQFLDQMSE
jgi:hypothetical protein